MSAIEDSENFVKYWNRRQQFVVTKSMIIFSAVCVKFKRIAIYVIILTFMQHLFRVAMAPEIPAHSEYSLVMANAGKKSN